MKNLSTLNIIFISCIILACSSKKEVNVTNNATFHSGITTSYGPKGQIITKQVELPNANYGVEISEAVATETDFFAGEMTASTEGFVVVAPDTSEHKQVVFLIKEKVGENSMLHKFEETRNILKAEAERKSFVVKRFTKYKEALANSEKNSRRNWAAILGFMIGVFGLFMYGLILGMLAMMLSGIGLESEYRGLAIAGFIIGLIDVIAVMIFIFLS